MSGGASSKISNKHLRVLKAALGYGMLGMFDDALSEIDHYLSEEQKAMPDTIKTRHDIYSMAKDWGNAAQMARLLIEIFPSEHEWWVSWAYGVRRSSSLEEAYAILVRALEKFPGVGIIPYNLACYECQMGNLNEAKILLDQAISIDKDYRPMAVKDPDLEAIWKDLKGE